LTALAEGASQERHPLRGPRARGFVPLHFIHRRPLGNPNFCSGDYSERYLREAAAFARFVAPSRRLGAVYAASAAVSSLPRYALQAVAVGAMVLVASVLAGRGEGVAGTLPLLGAYAFAGLRLMPALQVWFGAIARMRFARGALDAIEADLKLSVDLEPLAPEPSTPLPFAS
jgi:hypothetical protein